MRFFRVVFISFFLFLFDKSLAQTESIEGFHVLIKSAREYDKANLYAQETETLQKAISLAKKNRWEKERISATISLGELKRKTRDFQRGINLLMDLGNIDQFPLLNIRKMGRLAAIYNEFEEDPKDYRRFDSVNKYLGLAIPLAEKYNFEEQLASLKNELACFVQWTEGDDVALPLFKEASAIFLKLKDTANYVVLQTHIMNCFYQLNTLDSANRIRDHISPMIQNRGWFQIERNYYHILKNVAKNRADSIGYFKYGYLTEKSNAAYIENSFNTKMASLQVLFDVEGYKTEAEKKKEQLAEEEKRFKLLVGFVSVLLLLFLGIIFLLLRERKLKRVLNDTNSALSSANDKYQTLLVESNHRIKNNLQMIISMLDYSADEIESSSSPSFRRMSGKIQTVSALHKHLYLETHNENVNLKFYFNEILNLYERLSVEHFEIQSNIDEKIEIKSERLVYFGLIFNEMIANTLEHHTYANVLIKIDVMKQGNHFIYRYKDGSVFSVDADKGTGSLLIEELINRVDGFNFYKDGSIGSYQFEFYG